MKLLIFPPFQGKIVECIHCGCRGCSGWLFQVTADYQDHVTQLELSLRMCTAQMNIALMLLVLISCTW